MKSNNVYTGKPSIVLDHKPFFSIIVPCYNSRKTLGNLLESIVEQNMNDDIEVILSDDHSIESYQDIVDEYKEVLSIKQVQTDYNFAPGNTRQKGISVVEGEWIAFADHDDTYIAGTLPKIKQAILDANELYYAIANFEEFDPETGKSIRVMEESRNWNHAKFYNKNNFWDPFGIHFQKDLLTHEDICISSQVNCAIQIANGNRPLLIPIVCYRWNNRPTTISRVHYDDKSFIEVFFEDYLKSTVEVYLDWYLKGYIDTNFALSNAYEVLGYAYFYIQGFKFKDPTNYLHNNEELARRLLVKIKNIFGVTNENIYNYFAAESAIKYIIIRQSAYNGVGYFIEQESLLEWLNFLHEDIKPLITMSDAMHKE